MVDEVITSPEKSDRSSVQPPLLSFENVTLDDLKALASSTNGQQDTASDVLPTVFFGNDKVVLVAQAPEKTAKELIAEFQKIDKEAAAAFGVRPTFKETQAGAVVVKVPNWSEAAKLYGKEIEILEELAKKNLNEKDKKTVNDLLMRALRRSAFSISQLSTAAEILDPGTGKKPATPERDKEIRGNLRKTADERFEQLWNKLKAVQDREGDKAQVLLEWGENDLYRGKNKEAETKFKDALVLFDKVPDEKKAKDYQVRMLWDLGSAQLRQGNSAAGLKHLAQAIEVLKEMGKLSDADLFKKEDLTRAEHTRKLETLQRELALAQQRFSPGEQLLAQREQLLKEVQEAQNSPDKKGKWEHGTKLHRLGTIELELGKHDDAWQNLRDAVAILRKELSTQNKPEEAGKVLMQALLDYGMALAKPKQFIDTQQQILRHRRQADAVLAEAFTLAQKHKQTPEYQANILREKGVNQTLLATHNDVKTAEGKTAYRKEMQAAIDTLGEALKLMQNQNSNKDKASKALILGDLAFAEMSRVDKAGDIDALNAEKHYAQAIQLWKEYDPRKESKTQAESKALVDLKDKSLLTILAQYSRLLQAIGKKNEADKVLQELQEIIDRRPDLRIKK